MKNTENNQILSKHNCIAYREYKITKSGQILTLLLGKPIIYDGGPEYVAEYRFICDDFDEQYCIIGVDSIQALLLSIKMAEEFILNKEIDVALLTKERGIFLTEDLLKWGNFKIKK